MNSKPELGEGASKMRQPINDPRSVSELVSCAVGNADSDDYWGAIIELRARPTAEVFAQLAELAASDRPVERRVAADALRQFGWHDRENSGRAFEEEAAQILCSLLHDENLDVVRAAAHGLHFSTAPAAVPALLELVKHPNPDVRDAVERFLGTRTDPRSASELISCAVGSDPAESQRAVEALRARPTEDVFRLLARLARTGEASDRRVAALVLGQFGWRVRGRNGRFAFHADVVQILRSLLHDENQDVVEQAACALFARQDPAAVPDLLALVDNPDARIRAAVATALAGFEDDEVVEALLSLADDSNAEVRLWATFAFIPTEADGDRIRKVLAERLKDDNREIVLAATEALALREDIRAAAGLAILVDNEPIEELPSDLTLHPVYGAKLLQAYHDLLRGSFKLL